MLATKAVEYADNPFLWPKFFFIALALANLVALHLSTAWREHRVRDLTRQEAGRLSVFGAASLVFWLGAITCGRLIGYW
jgi:hypothetical protein